MNLNLCLAIAMVFTIASSDDPTPTTGGLVKFEWFSPISVDETALQEHKVTNVGYIVWSHFQQILYWLQQPEDQIHINPSKISEDVLLRQDLAVAYELKCMKATKEPYVFDNATIELSDCLGTYIEESNVDDVHSFINYVCRDPRVPTKCIEMYKLKLSRCLNADEMETWNAVQRIMEKLLSLNCEDSRRYFVSLMDGEANQCLKAHIDSMKICSQEFKYIFPMQGDTIQFLLKIESREKLLEKERCILSALGNCKDLTARDFYASLFEIINAETSFTDNKTIHIWHFMFIGFIICVALSFFVCVFVTSRSKEKPSS